MPVLRNVTLALVLAASAAGCGSGSSTPQVAAATSTSSPASSGGSVPASGGATSSPAAKDDHGVAWAKCMRSHGIAVSDPVAGGKGAQMLLPKSVDHSKADAAMKLCQKYLPDGGKLIKADPAVVAQERKMSQCMRENGLPKFPDPNADGGIELNGSSGLDPKDPTFIKAQNKCSKYAPSGPQGGAPHVQAGT